MKPSLVTILSSLAAFLGTSCQESDSVANAPKPAPENGAQFRKGQGLSLTAEMKKAIGFKTAEVTAEEISSSIILNLTAITGHEAAVV